MRRFRNHGIDTDHVFSWDLEQSQRKKVFYQGKGTVMNCRIVNKAGQYWQVINDQYSEMVAPWQIDVNKNSLDEIKAEYVLQYLTSMEADLALLKWFQRLTIGGQILLSVPDSHYFLRMWQNAAWNEQTLRNPESDARISFRMLWGAQNSGNPRNKNYDIHHGDVFKSAYNENRLAFLLERAGFVEILVTNNNRGTLSASARKSMDRGERQVACDYANIRADHKNRYNFASQYLKQQKPIRILDLACGIGYGSMMLSEETGAQVTGIDIDPGAVAYGKKYYNNAQTDFLCIDALNYEPPAESFDAIVSFETIEHVNFAVSLVQKFYQALKVGGKLICSTPNQQVMPFDKEKFPFHLKHYLNSELMSLLQAAGFKNIELFAQHDSVNGEVVPGETGCFTVAVAIKLKP